MKTRGKRRTKRKICAADRALIIFCYTCVFLVVAVTFVPFWELAATSLCTRADAARSGIRLFTANPTLDAYRQVLSSKNIWNSAWNSVVRVVLGTVISVGLTALTAYPLSKADFIGVKFFTVAILFTMVFSGGLIPSYFLITKTLHMTDSIWSMILPGVVGAYNLIIMRNFLRSIPQSLEDAARIDGAGELYVWWRIVMPLSKPVLATVALWKAVDHWNAYFDCLLYIRDQSKFVLQILLRRVLVEQQMAMLQEGFMMDMTSKPTEATVRAALILISTLPIVLVYPFLQKYFMQGIMLGGVKE